MDLLGFRECNAGMRVPYLCGLSPRGISLRHLGLPARHGDFAENTVDESDCYVKMS